MHLTETCDRLAQLEEQRDAARASRAYFSRIASEAQDDSYAAQTEGERAAKRFAAQTYRGQAGQFSALILDLSIDIAELESQLKSAPVQVAPVVLSRDSVEGMDDMAGVLA